MDKTKMMQQLMTTFLEELEEHVRAFNRDLLALEKEPPAAEQGELFKTLFRTAHSLKGAARSVNVTLIEGACHSLEEILTRVRDRQAVLDAELFDLVFATVDAIEEAGMRLRESAGGGNLAGAPLEALLPRLGAAATGAPAKAPPAEHVTAEAPVKEASAAPAPPSVAEQLLEPLAAASTVRVPAEKLDTLLARVGELLVARGRLEARVGELAALAEDVEHWKTEWQRVERHFDRESPAAARNGKNGTHRADVALRQNGDRLRRLDENLQRLSGALLGDARHLHQVTAPLNDEVRRVRMLPFAGACAGLDRMVRDLAGAVGKEIELVIEGGSVEMDRSILEGLKDPLRHLVRNAIDHGIEAPAQRLPAKKPRAARIRVAAALRGAQVEVHVEDDGRGLDLDAIRLQARRRQLDEPAGDQELARLIFEPGFSTASIITDVSGRGVGLDVVKNRVEALHGTVDLSYTAGQGTCFRLTVPLTLTTLRAVLVSAGGQTYAFAGTNIHKLVHAHAGDIRTVAGREVLPLDGEPLPFASLSAALGSGSAPAENGTAGKNIPVVVVAAGTARMAFSVDELLTEQEVLIKNLGTRVRRAPLVAGATLLPSGQLALVLNAANLARRVVQRGVAPLQPRAEKTTARGTLRKRLLVVEDSVTTRTLMKSILEAAGYEVSAAVNGQAGWQFLQDHEVDLVVSDVEMPFMDGFELTAAIRAGKKSASLPVVLVTALETEADKAHGIEVGADAYLVKSAFDQRNLLETIAQLL